MESGTNVLSNAKCGRTRCELPSQVQAGLDRDSTRYLQTKNVFIFTNTGISALLSLPGLSDGGMEKENLNSQLTAFLHFSMHTVLSSEFCIVILL